MERKLRKYVEDLFRNAPDTSHNRELKEEILQNTLDRFHDDVADGMEEEKAYQRAVANVGDVGELLEGIKPLKAKKHGAGWIVIAVLAVLIVALAVGRYRTSGAKKEDGAENSPNLGRVSYTYEDLESYSVGAAVLKDRWVDSLEVYWISGNVEVTVGDVNEPQIEELSSVKDSELLLRWRLKQGTLTIQPCAPGDYENMAEKTLRIILPERMGKRLKKIQVETVNSAASIWNVQAEEISLKSTGGDLFLDQVTGTSLKWESVSGELGGSGTFEKVELDTVSGDCKMALKETPEELSFHADSGSLFLTLPDLRSFEAELHTVSGELNENFPLAEENGLWRYEGPQRKPPVRFVFDTVSGNVSLQRVWKTGSFARE